MNREIKFRVLHKEDGFIINFKIDDIGRVFDEEGIKYCDVILMQFTGLRDKNGEEIYEGDIVELSPLRKGEPICICSIKYDGCSFELFDKNENIKYVRELLAENLCKNVKVIGNIYEDITLLQRKAK